MQEDNIVHSEIMAWYTIMPIMITSNSFNQYKQSN